MRRRIFIAAIAFAILVATVFWLGRSLFSDEPAYRACIGEPGERGIAACTGLLETLYGGGRLILKDIEDAKGDYWIAEIHSYRGRNHLRNGQVELGRADFQAALELRPGDFVILNNLAEAGYTVEELFSDTSN